jgi:tol-pal system protein YbgF
MIGNRFLLWGGVTWLLLCFGCSSSIKQVEKNTLLPEIDVVQVKEYSEEALKLAQEAKIDVQTLSSRLSEMDGRVVGLTEDVQSVSSAKIEELENRITLLTEAFKDLYEKMAAIEILPQIRMVTTKKKEPAVFSPGQAGKIVTSSEYDEYQEALETFDKRVYAKALEMFDRLEKKYPGGEYSEKALYWVGECYYAQADYARAIDGFSKVLKNEKSSKADDAQLKIGLCYLRMGKNDLAVEEFKRLIRRYPGSEYVPRAEKYLGEIKF